MPASSTILSDAIETADEAIGVYDDSDRLIAFNRRYREWRRAIGGDVRLGVPWPDLVRESVRCGAIPEARGREEQWLEQRIKARGAYSIVRKLSDGRAFKVSERKMANGGIVVIWTDITNLIEAQEARERESADDEQSLLTLGRLVAEVSHDFNNALTAIVGSLERLSKRLPAGNEGNARLVNNAILGARQGMAVAGRLLAVTRRETSVQEAIDVGATVAKLSEVLRDALSTSIDLSIDAPAELFFSAVNPSELEAAVVNLVLNARDAINGTGRVIVSLTRQAAAIHESRPGVREYVVLAVTDTGEGMDEATLMRATEPLFTTKERGKGTGLGLAAVKNLSTSVGGRLVLHSNPGMGTSAELWLPASPIEYRP